MSNEIQKDDFMKNFGMIIPTEPFKIPEMVEDPNGAPIYAGCKGAESEWGCACTGRCKQIVDYSQEPEKLAAYREHIRQYNERIRK